jgi:hypothetical protein
MEPASSCGFTCASLSWATTLLLTTSPAWAQEDTIPKKRLQTPATVAGLVGGESPDFFEGAQVAFGSASDRGRHWSGKVPRTGDYYIYVLAHPTAHYTLHMRAGQPKNVR